MKIDFNKNIQDSLRDYELPYDDKAWNELSKKLDQKMPVAKKPTYKWWILSSVVTAISVGSIYFIQPTDTKELIALNDSHNENKIELSEDIQKKENYTSINSKEIKLEKKSKKSNLSSFSNVTNK
jgi:hypothetical protein